MTSITGDTAGGAANKKKTAVLISGRGSNLQALIDAAATKDYPAQIALVISNTEGAGGLSRAQSASIPTMTIDHRRFGKGAPARAAFDAALNKALQDAEIELICLAGFMRLLGADFVNKWRHRMINIHPSLLPAYKGLNVHDRMVRDGVKIAGCTVHYVVADMDAGPIIGQAAVPVYPDDDADSLAARTLVEEHNLYPTCLRLVASGLATPDDDEIVRLPSDHLHGPSLHNPT